VAAGATRDFLALIAQEQTLLLAVLVPRMKDSSASEDLRGVLMDTVRNHFSGLRFTWFAGRDCIRLMAAGFMVCLVGCTADPKTPAWLSAIPASTQEICAIGISGPTYYPEDARARSQASAMAELARAVEVRVKTDLVLRSEGDSRSVETRLDETAGFGSDVVLKQAQVREQWVQRNNDHAAGEPGTVYTLICMPVMR